MAGAVFLNTEISPESTLANCVHSQSLRLTEYLGSLGQIAPELCPNIHLQSLAIEFTGYRPSSLLAFE